MNLKKELAWIFFVSRRFAFVDRKGVDAFTGFLSKLGICFGVMTLITVMSVMNGFQMEFIDAIMEISSYHIRVENVKDRNEFEKTLSGFQEIRSFTPFYETESIISSGKGRQSAALVRGVPCGIMETDSGFKKQMKMLQGSFDLHESGSIVLGSSLARSIGARLGQEINLLSIDGSSSTGIFSASEKLKVTGIFYCGYSDINAAYCFINIDDGEKFSGSSMEPVYGIKLKKTDSEQRMMKKLSDLFSGMNAVSWRDYNRSFFGALRIEKNMLFFMIILIFVVVAVNIFNSMRRIVYERRIEISIMNALGGNQDSIKRIFLMRGLITGLEGSIPGFLLGLLLSVNIKKIFLLISSVLYNVQLFTVMLLAPEYAENVIENPMYAVYAEIPARIFPGEVFFITVFGILAAFISSWVASREILNKPVSEVLHDE